MYECKRIIFYSNSNGSEIQGKNTTTNKCVIIISLLLHVHEQRYGTVIRAVDLLPDDAVAHVGLGEPLRGDKVVQPPSHVLGARVHHIRPEGEGALAVGVQLAEGVHKPAVRQKRREA